METRGTELEAHRHRRIIPCRSSVAPQGCRRCSERSGNLLRSCGIRGIGKALPLSTPTIPQLEMHFARPTGVVQAGAEPPEILEPTSGEGPSTVVYEINSIASYI